MNNDLVNYIAFVEKKTNDFHTISFWADSFSTALRKIIDDGTFKRVDFENIRSIKITTKGRTANVYSTR